MKKFLLPLTAAVFFFEADSDDINKKLDLILQQIQQLKQEVKAKDNEIEKLKKELKTQKQEIKQQEKKTQEEFAIKDCKKIGVVSLEYKYVNNIIPYYKLTMALKNNYPKTIVYLQGNLYAEDKDGTKILKDFIDRDIEIKPGETVVIRKKHMVDGELEEYLKDEKPENLKVYFIVTKAKFKDGTEIKCGLF
jgi:predicted RNase H-like nuclease (RuvC/YqgF family)